MLASCPPDIFQLAAANNTYCAAVFSTTGIASFLVFQQALFCLFEDLHRDMSVLMFCKLSVLVLGPGN